MSERHYKAIYIASYCNYATQFVSYNPSVAHLPLHTVISIGQDTGASQTRKE